ncbi:calcium-binding protein [Sphingobium sp. 22B]|uniref:EF-hand domain-containing protein n=1 Tax=unclassified Sphingobium TaxID=2611147 RepID=UPI000783D290|nr:MULTISPECIES: EF-hand domain-containing protein [unclassified Sphingobium]KXU29546.1 calcium-binding protein [Sphingobium sp. AM]KYC30115.1 calcium-binding protein [Sphingobium sp. 22B]OAP31553.1 calcium-binding protein [Sphingobium sp. 20006FA]
MIRKFMTTVALGSLFVGGLAASHLAFAQDDTAGPRGGGMLMMADANKDGAVTKVELTAALEARFARLDANKDGKLDQADRDILRQQRLDERFAALDTDRNGQISKAEFAAGHQGRDGMHDRMGKPGGPDGHGWGHRGWGKHGGGQYGGAQGMRGGPGDEMKKDGTITKAEFMARPLAMFDKADANHDGKVTADEMKAARQAFRDGWRDRKGPPPAN